MLLALTVGHAVIGPAAPATAKFGNGNVQGVATLIFTTYVFPFEVTSALLITAAVGAMVLAHRERTTPKPTQRELARRRVASGSPAPLPGPGTYARHNAVDMPALLPDGSPSHLSVSPVISRGGEPGQRELSGAAPGGSGPAGGRPDDGRPDDQDPDDHGTALPSEAGAGRPRGEARW